MSIGLALIFAIKIWASSYFLCQMFHVKKKASTFDIIFLTSFFLFRPVALSLPRSDTCPPYPPQAEKEDLFFFLFSLFTFIFYLFPCIFASRILRITDPCFYLISELSIILNAETFAHTELCFN